MMHNVLKKYMEKYVPDILYLDILHYINSFKVLVLLNLNGIVHTNLT